MIIELTDKFFDNYAIACAVKGDFKLEHFILLWSTIAKNAMQQGDAMANTIRIKRRVELHDGTDKLSTFKSMVDNGLLQTTESKGKLSPELFEQWWKAYPSRIVNGKKVKVGKPKTKKLFDNLITDKSTFGDLMRATENYSNVCNKLPKDPERWLRANFWKEYLQTESVPISEPNKSVEETDLDSLNAMLGK